MHTHPLPSLQRIFFAALAALLVTGLFQNVVGTTQEDQNGSIGYLCVMLAVNAALGAWLFLRVIPRAIEAGPQTAAKRALIMGVVAVVTVAAFWLGLPITVGLAAVVLGLEGRKRGGGNLATVAVVLGVLALLATLGVTVLDELGDTKP